MTVPEPGTWRTSRFSKEGDCVEIEGSLRAVRDSKNPAAVLPGVDVGALVNAVRSGQLG